MKTENTHLHLMHNQIFIFTPSISTHESCAELNANVIWNLKE